MKIKTTIHIHFQKWDFEEQGQYLIYSHKFDDTNYRVHVCECEVEVEVPDEFDPRTQQIAALEQQKQKAMAEYQKTLTDINEKISRLQAITHEA
jgi:GH35 family endo-1,4-beta-xylanase